MHWLENKSCDTKAYAHVSFPTTDAGIVVAGSALFSMPDSVLHATFPTLSKEELAAAKAAALAAPVPAVNPVCVERCAAEGYSGDGVYGSE